MRKMSNRCICYPRFDSQATFNETHLSFENLDSYDITNENRFNIKLLLSQTISHPQLASSLLPNFQYNHGRNYYDANQSADGVVKAISETNTE